ncbi:MAG: hypothetical protein EPN47_19670 [Acidobacteria bacterium]|nr:MAG: hypothetical protein EPN47_19670 [Acidobacteriota bacterium]
MSVLVLSGIFTAATGNVFAGQIPAPKREINWRAMGSTPCIWSPAVVGSNGAIDSDATIRILKQIGAGCYGALIWRGREHGPKPFDWKSFSQFVAAAQPAGIDVWAILIPPSEGGDSPPFNRDYVRWMQELARLSLHHSNLKGVNIDDYVSGISKNTFTPAYTCDIYRAKQAINPQLQFVPTIYDLTRPLAEKYGACVDGVWLWWTNLDTAAGLESWLENTRLAVDGRFPIYSGIYANETSWHHTAAPKPAILQKSVETACRNANGAIIWQMPLTPANPLLDVARVFGAGGSSSVAGRCGAFVPGPGH